MTQLSRETVNDLAGWEASKKQYRWDNSLIHITNVIEGYMYGLALKKSELDAMGTRLYCNRELRRKGLNDFTLASDLPSAEAVQKFTRKCLTKNTEEDMGPVLSNFVVVLKTSPLDDAKGKADKNLAELEDAELKKEIQSVMYFLKTCRFLKTCIHF